MMVASFLLECFHISVYSISETLELFCRQVGEAMSHGVDTV